MRLRFSKAKFYTLITLTASVLLLAGYGSLAVHTPLTQHSPELCSAEAAMKVAADVEGRKPDMQRECPTETPTETQIPTETPTETTTATETVTETATVTETVTETATATETATETQTATETVTATATETATATATETATETATPPLTPTPPDPACTITVAASDVNGLITAINTANGSPNPDIICLTNSTYTLSSVVASDSGLPVISSPISIWGFNATIERGASSLRHFYVTGSLTLRDMTLRNGNVTGQGGAIYNAGGALTVSNVLLTGNSSTGGGAIYNGGGIVNIAGSTLSGNTANSGSGGAVLSSGAGGSLTISASSITQNSAVNGGGIYNLDGGLQISGTTLTGNSATSNGGGIYSAGAAVAVSINNSSLMNNNAFSGGGIYNASGQLTLSGSNVSSNSAVTSGAAVSTTSSAVSASQICFVGNTAPGGVVSNSSPAGTADFANNWWGSATGPSAGMLVGSVNATPFLAAPAPACS